MKMEFLFSGLNLNVIIQKKAPEKCTFSGWCLRNKGHHIFKYWDFVAVCPPIKISGYAPATIPQNSSNCYKRSCSRDPVIYFFEVDKTSV